MLDEEQQLIAKLRKIEALFARPGTEGERRAAENASNRIRARLTALEEIEHPVEFRFSLTDAWSRSLFIAVLPALRAHWSVAIPLTWLFNVIGLLDLVNAFYQGLTHNVQLGAAYYIPTFIVPALVVSHVMMFRMVLQPTQARVDLPGSARM